MAWQTLLQSATISDNNMNVASQNPTEFTGARKEAELHRGEPALNHFKLFQIAVFKRT